MPLVNQTLARRTTEPDFDVLVEGYKVCLAPEEEVEDVVAAVIKSVLLLEDSVEIVAEVLVSGEGTTVRVTTAGRLEVVFDSLVFVLAVEVVRGTTFCVIRLLVFVTNSTFLKSVPAFSPLHVYASVVIGPDVPALPVALQPIEVVPLSAQSTVNLLHWTRVSEGELKIVKGKVEG